MKIAFGHILNWIMANTTKFNTSLCSWFVHTFQHTLVSIDNVVFFILIDFLLALLKIRSNVCLESIDRTKPTKLNEMAYWKIFKFSSKISFVYEGVQTGPLVYLDITKLTNISQKNVSLSPLFNTFTHSSRCGANPSDITPFGCMTQRWYYHKYELSCLHHFHVSTASFWDASNIW